MDPARLAAAFERVPHLVAPLLAGAPYPDGLAVAARARELLARMPESERVKVLDAHPRIGAPAATLAPLSLREQGPDAAPAVERELAELNEAYERRFGFRFVVFVRGRSRGELVPVLRDRLARTRAEELAAGLEEFLAIAADRLGRT